MKRRLIYAALLLVVIALGLGSRRYGSSLPDFLATYAGDTLWALAAFLALSALAPQKPLRVRAAAALLFSCAIEVSQLYHAPWIDGVRATTIGGLILGFGFLWSDLACYTAGVLLGALGEFVVLKPFRGKAHETPATNDGGAQSPKGDL